MKIARHGVQYMGNDFFINASKTSSLKPRSKYYGNYLGIVIQNNDPEKAGKIKVWVPHVSPSVYTKWTESNEDKNFKFIGKNINSDITDILEDLKKILPWAVCAAPLNGSSGSGRFNAYSSNATISDSNNVQDHSHNESYTKTKYSLNADGIGEKPGKKYEIQDLKVSDAFVNAGEVPFENSNKYGYNYTPSTYSNSAKGTFSVPNVGSHVWVFFDDGDPTSPVYFAVSYGQEDWKSIYDNYDNSGLDYPGSNENKNPGLQPNYNHNTETYRNKYVINQKGGTFEIINTDNREALKLTHFNGSFKELNNYTNTEFAAYNDQKLVQGDSFTTIRGYNNLYVQRDTDSIYIGDVYKKIGLQNPSVYKSYKDLLDPIADAKQLFEIKRAAVIETTEGYFKKTSIYQTRSGTFEDCPLCTNENRRKIWLAEYTFNSLTSQDYKVDTSTQKYNFNPKVSSIPATNAEVIPTAYAPLDKSNFLGSGNCPVCGGTGLSPSTYGGTWDPETDKTSLIIDKMKSINTDLIELEKQMGRGGSEIVSIAKNKIETVGLVFNDFPSIRVDDIGKIDVDAIKVFKEGVAATYKQRPLIEYVHVDDLPGGSVIQNYNNKWNVQVGAGGVSIKTIGGLDIGGSITNIAGTQTNVVAEEEINIDAKVVNIAAEILNLRNKNKKQVVIDSNLGVSQNVVVGGSVHIEGELSVQHITAPVEIQETEQIVLFSKLLKGLAFTLNVAKTLSGKYKYKSGHFSKSKTKTVYVGGVADCYLTTDSNDDLVRAYPHTHPFKNVPLKLMKTKEDVREVGQGANKDVTSYHIPVVNEYKNPEKIN